MRSLRSALPLAALALFWCGYPVRADGLDRVAGCGQGIAAAGASNGSQDPQKAACVDEYVPPLAYAGSPSATVGIASGPLIAPGAYKRILVIQTLPTSTHNVWLRPDCGVAAPNTGVMVGSGGGLVIFGTKAFPMPTACVNAITDDTSPQGVTLSGG